LVGLCGALPDGDGLAQAVKQPFEMGHALSEFGDLLLQSGESLAEFLPLCTQFPALFGQFVSTYYRQGYLYVVMIVVLLLRPQGLFGRK